MSFTVDPLPPELLSIATSPRSWRKGAKEHESATGELLMREQGAADLRGERIGTRMIQKIERAETDIAGAAS